MKTFILTFSAILVAGIIVLTARKDYLFVKNAPDYSDQSSQHESLELLINSDSSDEEIASKIINVNFSPAELNRLLTGNYTPVFLSIIDGKNESLKALLEKGADCNKSATIECSLDGQNIKIINATPLLVAALNSNSEAYKILLDAGADENASFSIFFNADEVPFGCLNFSVADFTNMVTNKTGIFSKKSDGEDLYVVLSDYILVNPERN